MKSKGPADATPTAANVTAPVPAPVVEAPPPETPPAPVAESKPCGTELVKYTMKDASMKGAIEQGEKYTVAKGWYSCHPVKVGDIVSYSNSAQMEPIPLIVRAVPGSKFTLSEDKEAKGWNVTVDGKKVLTDDDKAYVFGHGGPGVLGMYEKSYQKSGLPTGQFLLFGNQSRVGSDSSVFGVVNLKEILGKVQE